MNKKDIFEYLKKESDEFFKRLSEYDKRINLTSEMWDFLMGQHYLPMKPDGDFAQAILEIFPFGKDELEDYLENNEDLERAYFNRMYYIIENRIINELRIKDGIYGYFEIKKQNEKYQ